MENRSSLFLELQQCKKVGDCHEKQVVMSVVSVRTGYVEWEGLTQFPPPLPPPHANILIQLFNFERTVQLTNN